MRRVRSLSALGTVVALANSFSYLRQFACSALKTPQVLELSGIGRKSVLDKINIPLQIDLPGVGENVQEHIFAQLSWGECLAIFHWTPRFSAAY